MNGKDFPPIGRTMAALREMRGWTQRELSEKTGIGSKSISSFEGAREKSIRVGDFLAIADALSVPPEALVRYVGKLRARTGDHGACTPKRPASMCDECRQLWDEIA